MRSFSSPENRNLPRTCGRLFPSRPEAISRAGFLSCDLLRMVRSPSQCSTTFLGTILIPKKYYKTMTPLSTVADIKNYKELVVVFRPRAPLPFCVPAGSLVSAKRQRRTRAKHHYKFFVIFDVGYSRQRCHC